MPELVPAREDWQETRPSAPAVAAGGSREWSWARRLWFRFGFLYLVVYNLPVALAWTPWSLGVLDRYLGLFRAVVPWVGRRVLHLGGEVSSAPTGSGDRTFDYVQVLCMAALAAGGALLWTVAARRRRQEWRLREGLRIYLRYTLGFVLLAHGMSIVFGVQFPFPAIDRLQERVGDSSPMALLWTFMGYSRTYTMFLGVPEALSGLLLFFRRTTTLGALAAIAVSSHAIVLDFSYDVPQKLAALHLLLMSAWLLAPEVRRLADGLVLDRPTVPADVAPPFAGRRARMVRPAVKALVVGWALCAVTAQSYARQRQLRLAPRPELYGVYDVEDFVRNGQAVPSWSGDPARWRRLVVPVPQMLAVAFADDSQRSFATEYGVRQVALLSAEPGGRRAMLGRLDWSRPDPDHLLLAGSSSGDSLVIRLRRIDAKYLLVTRGFHLIDDDPINR